LYIQTSKLLGNQKPPQLVEVECRIWRSIFRIAQNQADVVSEMRDLSSWITVKEADLRRDEGKIWFKLAEESTVIDMSWTSADIEGPLPSGWAIPDFLNTSISSRESAMDQALTLGGGDENMDQEVNQDLQAGSGDERGSKEPDGCDDDDMGKEVKGPGGDGDEDMGAPDGDSYDRVSRESDKNDEDGVDMETEPTHEEEAVLDSINPRDENITRPGCNYGGKEGEESEGEGDEQNGAEDNQSEESGVEGVALRRVQRKDGGKEDEEPEKEVAVPQASHRPRAWRKITKKKRRTPGKGQEQNPGIQGGTNDRDHAKAGSSKEFPILLDNFFV
jgi:hypothetical protein